MNRIGRALSENILYTFESEKDDSYVYSVIGNTGNSYVAQVGKFSKSNCTCPDFQINDKLCKHLICILIKNYQVSINNLTYIEKVGVENLNTDVRLNENCPICFNNIEYVEYVCQQCKNVFHHSCILKWYETLKKQKSPLSCPMCRHLS